MNERKIFCGNCGAQVYSGSKFCSACGAAVTAPQAPAQQVLPQRASAQMQQQFGQPIQQPMQQPIQRPIQQYAQPAYAAQAPVYVDESKKKKKKGFTGAIIALVSVFLVVALLVTGFVWPAFIPKIARSLASPPEYVTKGYTGSVTASKGSDTSIGDIDKEGISLKIGAGAFKDGSKVKLDALTQDKSKQFEQKGYNIVGSVISVDVDGYNEELFAEPVTLTLDLPVAEMDSGTDRCDYFVGYYNEKTKEWQLYEPEDIDVRNGRATIDVMHFTHLAIIDPEENETVEKYLKDYCAEKARQQTIDEEGKEAFQPYVKAIADKMAATKEAKAALAEALIGKLISGINTDSKTGKIVSGSLDYTNTVGWGAYRATQGDDPQEFKDALKTATVKALGSYMTDDGNFVNFLGSAGTIGTMAGQIEGGDYTGALQSAEDAALNFFPTANAVDKAAKYVVRKVDMDYTMWKKDRIDDLYIKWRDGFETHPGQANSIEIEAKNFDELLAYMEFDTHSNKSGFGNADMMLKRIYDSDQKIDEQVERYGFGHKTYKSLSDDEKEQFQKRVTHGLKEYFEQRFKNETKAKSMEQEEIKYINNLYKWGYLRSDRFTEYFRDGDEGKFSISSRLTRLLNIKNTIEGYVDPKKMKENYGDLSYLATKWIEMNDGRSPKEAKIEFLKYLKEEGLLKDGINIPGLDDVTIDDIVGEWDVDAQFTDINSPMLDWFSQLLKDIAGGIAEDLGGSADDLGDIGKLYDENESVKQNVTIKKLSKDKVSVVVSSSGSDSATYEGTLKDGVLSLKLTKGSSSEDGAVVLDIQSLKYKFYKTNGYVKMEGTYNINSPAFNATYIYTGSKA